MTRARVRGRRLGRRFRCLGRPLRAGRQEAQWIDVAVGIGRQSDAEMDVGLGVLWIAARSDRSDSIALGDDR
jgi:hypothetical protein